MLITKLYKDEEWPLKQVIKLVQTTDFHPRYVHTTPSEVLF